MVWYQTHLTKLAIYLRLFCIISIWVRSRNCGCLFTWFCYQLIAKPGNKTAAVSWPDQYEASTKWPTFVIDIFKCVLQESDVLYFTDVCSPASCWQCISTDSVNTLRPRQMAAIFQTAFSNAFSWMKMYQFRLRFVSKGQINNIPVLV